MNNLRLLTAVLLSGGLLAGGQTVVSLEEIFSTAEANSVQLRPSLTAVEEARHDIDVAKNALLPEINSSFSLSYIADGFTTRRNFSDYQRAEIPHLGNGLSVSIEQPVYTGGAITKSIELAELKLTASRFAADFKRDNLRFSLAGFYLDLYKYYNLQSVVESNIAAARSVLENMKSRYKAGTALLNDITRYELLISNLELDLTRINNTITVLNTNLVTIAGMDPDISIRPDSALLLRSMPECSVGQWQEFARENSPAISLARSEVEISRKAEALVRTERLPKIGIRGGWSIDGPILVEVPPINRNLSYWYVGVGVSYNISSLYKNNRSLAKSRVSTLHAIEKLDATCQDVELSLRADHVRYLEAFEELKSRDKAVELADRNYRTTSTRYAAGMALVTDMLDAANACLDAQQQRVNARINIIYYYYKLLFTSGKI